MVVEPLETLKRHIRIRARDQKIEISCQGEYNLITRKCESKRGVIRERKMRTSNFNNIDWNEQLKTVSELQEKIVVAWKQGDKEKVIRLQQILVRSFAARSLAVKRVISNSGGRTAGVDGEIWDTEEKRDKAISDLREKGKPLPLKRIYIPKSNGKLRPISIPSMLDRAKQALHLMALDPIAEEEADERSYGFRKYRSCQDAIEYLYLCLHQKDRARIILDADIKGFFDNINHEWILKNIPMDKSILEQWLKAGYLDKNIFHNTEQGVPQGGIISPTIANMVLNGLEDVVKDSVSSLKVKNFRPKVNLVRYADDFIVTAASKEILTERVIPAITKFLKERGLELNMEKTVIRTITEGFDFLGVNFKKFEDTKREGNEMLIVKPSKKGVKNLKEKIKKIISTFKEADLLISKLNPVLRGWGQYYKTVMSKRTFTKINFYLWSKLWQWVLKKHPTIGKREAKKLYFKRIGTRDWIFFANNEKGTTLELFDITSIPIKTQIICRDLNPYLAENKDYFASRSMRDGMTSLTFNDLQKTLLKSTEGICKVCSEPITMDDEVEIHHILAKKDGGEDKIKNLLILHEICHRNVTLNKDPNLRAKYLEIGIIKEPSKGSPKKSSNKKKKK